MTNTTLSLLDLELKWLLDCISWRWRITFEGVDYSNRPSAPELLENSSPYQDLVNFFSLNEDERLVLTLTLAPFFIPNELYQLVTDSTLYEPLTYGARAQSKTGLFIPTGTTAIFLLGGKTTEGKLKALHLLKEHSLVKLNLISTNRPVGDPLMSGSLLINDLIFDFLSGIISFNQLPDLWKDKKKN